MEPTENPPPKPRRKQPLWFDPKHPPVTPVYVGQKKPIYLVPEDTGEDDRIPQDDWEKTEWYFEIVGIRQIIDEEGDKRSVVDVKWPNGYVDHDVPISDMYGTIVSLKRSQVAKYTEEHNSDDEYIEIDLRPDQTGDEKILQIMKLLKYISDNHEYLVEQCKKEEAAAAVNVVQVTDEAPTAAPTSTVEKSPDIAQQYTETSPVDAGTSDDGISVIEPENTAAVTLDTQDALVTAEADAGAGVVVTLQQINDWFLTPAKGGLSLGDLRKKALELGIADPQQYKRQDLRKCMTDLAVDRPVNTNDGDGENGTPEAAESVTQELLETWFALPSKGGLSLAELRKKATSMGIEKPQEYKRAELKQAMEKAI